MRFLSRPKLREPLAQTAIDLTYGAGGFSIGGSTSPDGIVWTSSGAMSINEIRLRNGLAEIQRAEPAECQNCKSGGKLLDGIDIDRDKITAILGCEKCGF